MAKDYFNEKKVVFTDYDVAVDLAKRKEMVDVSKQMGVPVIKIDDEIIVGFNQAKIDQLLGL
jgi:glutaredoxin